MKMILKNRLYNTEVANGASIPSVKRPIEENIPS